MRKYFEISGYWKNDKEEFDGCVVTNFDEVEEGGMNPTLLNFKNKNMKRFNYYYDGTAIPKERFLQAVPENWQEELNKYGEYSYGSYRAVEVELIK